MPNTKSSAEESLGTQPCSVCGGALDAGGNCPACLAAFCLADEPIGVEAVADGAGGRFGDFELLEQIGRGGMGMVFKARRIEDGEIVALKLIPEGLFANPKNLQRFQREREILSRLKHPAIVQFHEEGAHDGMAFFTMNFVDGVTLDRACAEDRHGLSLPVSISGAGHEKATRHIARFFLNLCRAVQSAHEVGVVHRDLKPSNILVDQQGLAHITDFGIAVDLDSTSANDELTLTGQMIGTPHFMAPEQIRGEQTKCATDVWALGSLLYFMLGSRPPFVGENEFAVFDLILRSEPVPPSSLEPGLPKALERICIQCLRKDPEKRYVDAGALADDLQRFVDGKPVMAKEPGFLEKSRKLIRRHRVIAASLITAFALLLIGGAVVTKLWLKESAARKTAVKQVERAEKMGEFLSGIIRGLDPAIARGRDTELLHALLDDAVAKLDDDEFSTLEVEMDLRQIVGEGYHTIEVPEKAAVQYERCLVLQRSMLGSDHFRTRRTLLATAEMLADLGDHQKSASLIEEILSTEGIETSDPEAHRLALFQAARIYRMQDRPEEARDILMLLVDSESEGVESVPPRFLLAGILFDLGDSEAALSHFQKCTETLVSSGMSEHPFVADARIQMAEILAEKGELKTAMSEAADSVRIYRVLFGEVHPGLLSALLRRAAIARQAGDASEAGKSLREAISIARSLEDSESLLDALIGLGETLSDEKRFNEAVPFYEEAVELVDPENRELVQEYYDRFQMRWKTELNGKKEN